MLRMTKGAVWLFAFVSRLSVEGYAESLSSKGCAPALEMIADRVIMTRYIFKLCMQALIIANT